MKYLFQRYAQWFNKRYERDTMFNLYQRTKRYQSYLIGKGIIQDENIKDT